MENEQRLRIRQSKNTTEVYLNDSENPIELKEGEEMHLLLHNTEVSSQIPLPSEYISAKDTINNEMPAVYKHVGTGVTFDLDTQKINFEDNSEQELTPSEAEIMKLMIESPRNILFTQDYIDRAYKEEGDSLTSQEARDKLKVYIRRIRRKIEEGGVDDKVIETIRGKGYRVSGSIKNLFEEELN